jgi:hypothetical protein
MPDSNDRVGYRRPPRATQFKPGQSGNPGGRPKKLPSLRADLDAELSEQVHVKDGDLEVTVSKQRAFIKTLVAQALGGDGRAAAAVIALAHAPSREGNEAANSGDEALLEQYVAREVDRRLKKNNT